MHDLIIEYLETNYKMTVEDYVNGRMSSRFGIHSYLVTDVINDVETVFGYPKHDAHDLVNAWWDTKEAPFVRAELDFNRIVLNNGRNNY